MATKIRVRKQKTVISKVVAKKTAKKVVKPKQLVNKIAYVMDASGSMICLKQKAIDTANSWIATTKSEAQKSNQKTLSTLVTFDYKDNVQFVTLNDENFPTFNSHNYRPDGMTALITAVTKTIKELDKTDTGKESFLVVVITDGLENDSHYADIRNFGSLISSKQGTDRWTFVFMVPPGHKNTITQYGIPVGNVREWETSEKGLQENEVLTSGGIRTYYDSRSAGKMSVSCFYVQPDLSKVNVTKVKRALDDITSRCEVFTVDKENNITDFVEKKTKRPYVKGSTYYQLMKKELIQPQKDIVLAEKMGSKRIYSGSEARKLIGLPEGANAKVEPGDHAKWDIFVQSTSVNRILPRGTKILVKS